MAEDFETAAEMKERIKSRDKRMLEELESCEKPLWGFEVEENE